MDSYEFTVQPGDRKSVIYKIIADKLGTEMWKAIPLRGALPFDGNDLDHLAGCAYMAVPVDTSSDDSFEFTLQDGDTKAIIYQLVADGLGTEMWRADPIGGAPVFNVNHLTALVGYSYEATPV